MALGRQLTHANLLVAFLQTAAAHGVQVGEHPAFGGVHPVHVANSWHYDGLAADLNTRAGASAAEKSELAPWADLAISLGIGYFLNRTGRGIGAAATHNDHLHVDCGGWYNFGNGDLQVPGTPSYPVLYNGSHGLAVEVLQRVLVLYGFNPGPIDGRFGPKVEAAVREYQIDRALKNDGVVGPISWGQIRLP